jgi:hypothetical protein
MRALLVAAGMTFLVACGDDSPAVAVSPSGGGSGGHSVSAGGAGAGGVAGQGGAAAGNTSAGGQAAGAGADQAIGGSAGSAADPLGGSAGEGGASSGTAGTDSAGGGAGTGSGGVGQGGSGQSGAGQSGAGQAGATTTPEVVTVGDDAKSPAPGPVRVHLDQAGTKFTDWGFDIKQSCGNRAADGSCVPPVAAKLAASQPYANEIFQSGQMAVIRIPIRADELGVNASGGLKEGFYKEVIQAVKNAKAANPQVRVFASRSTISDCSLDGPLCKDYADSLKNGGVVVIAKYAKLLSQYLTFMAGSGVPIDVLGVENEPSNNFGEGNLATCFKKATDGCADRFYALLASLKSQHPKPLPLIVGDDAGWPDVDFADALTKDGKWGLFDVITTHYQSGDRSTRHALLDSLAAQSHKHNHPLWDTEYHYDDIEGQGEYSDAALGVFGVLDHFDAGFTGITWWAFKPRSVGTSKAQIQSALVESTTNTVPLGTDDGDETALTRTTLGSRAFRRGNNQIMVWLVNDTDKPSTGKPIRILSGSTLVPPTGPARYEQWVLKPSGAGGVMSHDEGRAFPVKAGAIVASLPARSITVVTIPK